MNIFKQINKFALVLILLSVPCSAVELTCPEEYNIREASSLGPDTFFRGMIKIDDKNPAVRFSKISPTNYIFECRYSNGSFVNLEVPSDLYTCKQEGTRVDCTKK